MIPQELIYNLTLLVALSLISGLLDKFTNRDSLKGKVSQGMLFGTAVIIGMMFPMLFFDGVIFDGRSILLSLCGVFFGPITAIIAGILSLTYRLFLGGSGSLMGSLVIIESVAVGLAFYYYNIRKKRDIRISDFVVMGLIVHILMLVMMMGLPNALRMEVVSSLSLSILTIYPIATVLIGSIMLDQYKNRKLILELSISKHNLSTYFELAPDAIFVVNSFGKYIDANPAAEKMTGFTKSEILKKTVLDLILDIESARSHFAHLLKNGSAYSEMKFVRKDGSIGWWTVDAVTINDDKFLGFSKDITYKKIAENELIESESKFRDLINRLPDGYYRSSPEGKFIYVNPAYVEMLGYDSSDELLKVDIINDLYESPEERDNPDFVGSDISGKYEIYKIKRKDGRLIWIEDHSTYIYDENGKVVQNEGICRDITQRLESDKAHDELLSRIVKISAHLPGFIHQFHLSNDGKMTFPYSSRAIFDIYGITPDEAKYNTDSFLKALHPDDAAGVLDSIAESAKKLTIWKCEYRVIKKNGETTWVEGYSSPEKLEDGSVLWHGYISDINERKKTEEIIRESEFSLRFAQEIVKMGSWEFDYFRKELKWSENYFKLFGYEPFSFVPDNQFFLQRIHPEDYDYVENELNDFIHKATPGKMEFRIVMPDGTIKWIQNTYLPFFKNDILTQIKGVNIDITEMKISENSLRNLSRAVEQSPMAIVITSFDGNIEYVNPKFVEMTGYSENEVIGQNPRILKSNEMSNQFYAEMWKAVSGGHEWKSEIINRRKNGELYWESIIIAPVINDKGEIIKYIAIKEDIGDKKIMQEELVMAKLKAEESDRLKSAFIANMSHEIRTPLNGIIGFSRMLQYSDITDEERSDYSQVLNMSCDRLLNTVNDILDISKIEANQVELNMTDFIVLDLFAELTAIYSKLSTNKGLIFETDFSDLAIDYTLYSDEQRIYQVLNNLLSNAVKFTEVGTINFGCKFEENFLEIYVTDTGIGVSDKAKDFIFGRFNQENIELNRGFEGTGLGLAISKGLLEILGGEINLKSRVGEGSTFVVRIPLS